MATNGYQADSETRGRAAMHKLWDRYKDAPTIESMMLNDNAEKVSCEDARQILGVLPNLEDKDVLEIGAGIGRFTGYLAQKARSVVSTDFIDSFIEKNKEIHGHHSNISYEVGDATSLQYKNQSFDFVFTNWLFMYLTNEEVVDTISNIMNWLRPGGRFHMRESCTESSNKKKSQNIAENPTYYRHISQYLSLLRNIRVADDCGKVWKLDVTWTNSVEIYITQYHNWRQVHMMVEKVPSSNDNILDRQLLLSDKLAGEVLDQQINSAQKQRACENLIQALSPVDKYLSEVWRQI